MIYSETTITGVNSRDCSYACHCIWSFSYLLREIFLLKIPSPKFMQLLRETLDTIMSLQGSQKAEKQNYKCTYLEMQNDVKISRVVFYVLDFRTCKSQLLDL